MQNNTDLAVPSEQLKFLFNAQADFQKRLFDIKKLSASQLDLLLEKNAISLSDEAHEILRATNWKHKSRPGGWKETKIQLNREYFLKEYADIFIFCLNGFIYLNCTHEEVFNEVLSKIKVNHDRQDSKY